MTNTRHVGTERSLFSATRKISSPALYQSKHPDRCSLARRVCSHPSSPVTATNKADASPSVGQDGRTSASNEVSTSTAYRSPFHTGSMDITTAGATTVLHRSGQLVNEKTLVIVRHGLSTWNEQKRIQGASSESSLTWLGIQQAERCRQALEAIPFDSCFSSPITRARQCAEICWQDRPGPLVYLDTLKEADLGRLQGMKNEVAARDHEETFRMWRQQPADFSIDGRYPVREVFDQALLAWQDILDTPGSSHLVVTHKSILRAFLCVALGLPASSFRAVDINNGGISVFKVNKRGEPMLTNLNSTAHLHCDGVYY